MANPLEHSHVLRVIGNSDTSLEDAVRSGLMELTNPYAGHTHHKGYRFTSFEVVKFAGLIEHDDDPLTFDVTRFSVTMDVTAVHQHDDASDDADSGEVL
ncbi:MAG: hypothetical protein AAF494_10305 [Pseudomonadota bacterium]